VEVDKFDFAVTFPTNLSSVALWNGEAAADLGDQLVGNLIVARRGFYRVSRRITPQRMGAARSGVK
jgi:hypothetical protein